MAPLRLGIVYGGRSSEHDVSLRSARSVFEALDRDKYDPVLIGIDPEGRWHLHSEVEFLRLTAPATNAEPEGGRREVTLPPRPAGGELLAIAPEGGLLPRLDVVFPLLHGARGEDGTIQGLLELAEIPYVGAGVLGSALGMDKDVQKRVLRDAGLPIVDFVAVRHRDWCDHGDEVRRRAAALPYPVFVKPANAGSSVGVTRVQESSGLDAAIEEAFQYDTKILIERGLDAREIECSVLGNESPEVSVPGEICPRQDFYSYEAKYLDEQGAAFLIPAPLPPEQTAEIRAMAAAVFQALECEGMARVDFFLERETERVFVNEINTIPGVTSISQYPRLWDASGLPFPRLLDRLVELAVERHARKSRLRSTR